MPPSTNAQSRQAGDIDTSFGTDGYLDTGGFSELGRTLTMALSKNGVITHATELYGKMSIDRALIDGTKDAGFNAQRWNFEEGDNSRPNRLLLQKLTDNEQDERIVIVGESLVRDEPTGLPRYRPAVMRLLANGSPDLVFGRRILPQPDNSHPEYGFARPTSDGCLQQDGRILITATYLTGSLYESNSRLYCVTRTGELDNQFGQGGFVEIRLHDKPSHVCAVQIQSNGNIVVAGYDSGNVTLARYSPSGVLDNSFGDDGFIDIPTDPTSEKVSAPTTLINLPSRLLVMDDNRIVFTGFRNTSGRDQGLIMRLTADGRPDSSFNGGELVYFERDSMDVELTTVAIQPDRKIVVAGRGVNRELPLNQIYGHKWRLLENGSLDPTFNSESLRGEFADIAIQTNGRILLAGSSGFAWSSRFPKITALTGQ